MVGDREARMCKVTIIGGVANAALLAFKFVAGIVGHSSAMIADAVHSFSDFITDVIVLVFVRISGKPQDSSHDYGHGKYETLASTVIGIALLAVAVGIIVSGAQKIALWVKGEELASPGTLAFWAAIVSIVVKEITYRYTIAEARRLDSSALKANAWHHRSDAFSSIGTAIGIGGAIFLGKRWTVLDPLAGVIVGAVLIKVAVDMVRDGIGDLMEKSLPDDVENEILAIVTSFSDVHDPHNLRTRRIGNRIAIEIHVRMDGSTDLNTSHQRASDIETALRAKFGPDTHVTVHMEPIK